MQPDFASTTESDANDNHRYEKLKTGHTRFYCKAKHAVGNALENATAEESIEGIRKKYRYNLTTLIAQDSYLGRKKVDL